MKGVIWNWREGHEVGLSGTGGSVVRLIYLELEGVP